MKSHELNFILLILFIAKINFSYAQFQCGTTIQNFEKTAQKEHLNKWRELEEYTRLYKKSGIRSNQIYEVPIVFHIVMEDPFSIDNTTIQEQLNRLNLDFRAKNSDTSSVPEPFKEFIGDSKIEFRMASVGQNCDGIIRKITNKDCFDIDLNDIKSSQSGGSDPIDPEHILNFWVGNICPSTEGQTIGYSQFPGGDPMTDGVVVLPEVFGQGVVFGDPHNLGRIGVHEVGHYFNLIHIWGDDTSQSNQCAGSDFCDDTPNQEIYHFGCLQFPKISCDNGPHGDMFMNFMDYTDDSCKKMFTKDQIIRMQSALLTMRSNLLIQGPQEFCCELKDKVPILSAENCTNPCGTNYLNLDLYHVGNIPQGAQLIWSTDSDPVNGIDPIIEDNVYQSGNYYAYYYVETTSCFSQHSSLLTVVINDLSPGNDKIIQTDTTFNSDYLFNNNLIVENNATLQMELATFKFVATTGIIVKNGGKLIVKFAKMDACDPSQSWDGLKIEPGGYFETNNSELYNANIGVYATGNSTIKISELSITGKNKTTGVGFRLDGNVNAEIIYGLHISYYHTAIYTSNSNKLYEFNHGNLFYNTFGIKSKNSPLMINDYGIEFTKHGIDLSSSPFSSINGSFIRVEDQGISIFQCSNTIIKGNLIDNMESLNTWPAILLIASDNCSVINNPQISSANNGISSFGSSYTRIDGNFIETQFNSNTQLAGGPVNLAFGNNNLISNNFIEGTNSEFCIHTTWNNGSTIENNNITANGLSNFYRTAAIKQTGNLDETLKANYIDNVDYATGILVQNSSGGKYNCNDVFSSNEGLDIYYGSDEQWITANTIDATLNDLAVRSMIGEQATRNLNDVMVSNNGNEFVGGYTMAIQEVVDESRFPVNGENPYHMPKHPTPSSGWFSPNEIVPFEDCDGVIIGPDWLMFNNDPNKICSYWNYLKSIQTTKPELFFVKLFHLLKYAKTKHNFTLPNCIKFDAIFQALCGVNKLVDISVALSKIGEYNANTTNVQALQTQYNNEASDEGKAVVRNQMTIEMASLIPLFNNEALTDSIRLDSLKNELNSINCPYAILNKWKEILKIYINFIRKGKVDVNDKVELESYSSDCSDLYGEAIHLARSMANTYTNSYYDEYDGCLQRSEPRLTSKDQFTLMVAPNPTTGKISIILPANFEGKILVYDLNGRIIKTNENIKASIEFLDISYENDGLYILRVIGADGKSSEHKVLLIK